MNAQPLVLSPQMASGDASQRAVFFAPMQTRDLLEVMRIERQAYPWPWSEGNVLDSIAQGHQCQILRGHAGQLLGYFMAMLGAGEVHLLNITVCPSHQRQGWARVMLDALHDWARKQQASSVWLEVRVSNVRAIAVYESYGFSRVALRKAYYPFNGLQREDAIVMCNSA
jgi:[ribosomal protein S18]-alanine N-acetyltransferase